MSNEERQRILREAGNQPAEAEKEAGAESSKEKLSQQEGPEEGPSSPDEPTPVAQEDDDRPTPRR